MSFAITYGKGFHIKFDNGITVSVQFGPGSYCENYDKSILEFYQDKNPEAIYTSKDAEVAAWNKNGVWYNFETEKFEDGTDPIGHVSPANLLMHMNKLSSFPDL